MNKSHSEERLFFTMTMQFAFENDTRDATDLLRASVGITTSKSGCLACCLIPDEATSLKLGYREEWETEAQFRRHAGSREFKHVLTAIDMCSDSPEIKIGKLTTNSGVESLKEIYFDESEFPLENIGKQK